MADLHMRPWVRGYHVQHLLSDHITQTRHAV